MWRALVLLLAAPTVVKGGLKTAPAGLTVKEFLLSQDFQKAVSDVFVESDKQREEDAGTKDKRQQALRGYVSSIEKATPEELARWSPPRISPADAAEIIKLFRKFPHMTLKGEGPHHRRLSLEDGLEENVTYQFHSFDSEEHRGTGMLGRTSGGDAIGSSVSEVSVVRTPGGIKFTIGPPIAGHFLIGGTLEVQHRDGHRMSGKIRAAFVNLRTTLMGTWECESTDLHSELHIHLAEVGFQEDWTWKPEKSPSGTSVVSFTNITTKGGE